MIFFTLSNCMGKIKLKLSLNEKSIHFSNKQTDEFIVLTGE